LVLAQIHKPGKKHPERQNKVINFRLKYNEKITAKKCENYHDKYREQLTVNPRSKRRAVESAKLMCDDCCEIPAKYC